MHEAELVVVLYLLTGQTSQVPLLSVFRKDPAGQTKMEKYL